MWKKDVENQNLRLNQYLKELFKNDEITKLMVKCDVTWSFVLCQYCSFFNFILFFLFKSLLY
jgi:hypothetical protein